MINGLEYHFEIDWHKGYVFPTNAGRVADSNNVATITFCGDWEPSEEHFSFLHNNPKDFYGDLLPYLLDSDLVVVNVEGPIRIQANKLVKDGPNLVIEPEILSTLSVIECKVACLANNHIMDLGASGLEKTVEALHRMGMQATGAGKNLQAAESPFIKEINGVKFAIINVAEGEEAKAEISRAGAAPLNLGSVCNRVSKLSRDGTLVFVVVHAGREYIPVPPPYIQNAYRTIADAGAALIIGHHPHVPQGVEIWNGVPIFYSLGNFVMGNGKNAAAFRDLGFLLETRVTEEGISGVRILPYRIRPNGLESLQGLVLEAFLQNLGAISEMLDPESVLAVWEAYADSWFKARFSQEVQIFTQLMSWCALLESLTDRIRLEALKSSRWLNRFVLRVLGFILHRVARVLPAMPELVQQPAAVLRNRFDTPAHRELYRLVLQRVVNRQVGASADWARELLVEWKVFDEG